MGPYIVQRRICEETKGLGMHDIPMAWPEALIAGRRGLDSLTGTLADRCHNTANFCAAGASPLLSAQQVRTI
jgi:hypothetical protein